MNLIPFSQTDFLSGKMARNYLPLLRVVVGFAFLASAILLLDLSLPLGVAAGVPYVAVVLVGWWLKHSRYIFVLAVVCTVLTVIGYLFSTEAGIPWMVVANRILALFAIWVTAALLALAKRSEQALRRSRDELEQGIDERTIQLQKEVSAHKQAEEEVRASQRPLETVFNTVPHSLWVKNRDGRHDFLTEKMARNYLPLLRVVVAFAFLASAILLLDLSLPLGVAAGVPYVAVILVGWWLKRSRYIFVLAVVCTVLTAIGYLFSAEAGIPWMVVTNRILALFAIWVTAVLLVLAKRSERALRRSHDELEQRIHERTIQLQKKVSEHERAEEALRESEERFRAIFENSPSPISLKDLEGRFQLMNRSFGLTYEVSVEDAIGKTSAELFETKFADQVENQDRNVMETGQLNVIEVDMPLSGGGIRTVVNTKFPILDGKNQLTGVGTIATDVTEQRKIEQQLRESHKMEAVGQLAGGIAHEFNNMLQVIINSAHFARNSIHEPQIAVEFLGTILRSAERSATLTKQLLAFSRKTALVPAILNLNEMTSNLMKMVRPVIGEDIVLEFKQADDLFHVKADATLLEQTLLNLCVNARDAMPDGGCLIFETRNHHADQEFCDNHGWSQPGDYAMISVSDNGAGMTSEIREHIFEPFFTTKEVGQGTGLGLAMVHGIVQQHDGVVEALSEPGVGSTFNIYLPRTDSQEAGKQGRVVGVSPGGSETILVAEDEEDVLNMLSQTLEIKGYRVLATKDGEEAMAVFKANADRIDLVILDMVMPKMNGRAVFEGIREKGSSVPVLFSTGYSLDSSDAEYVAGRGVRTIQKPYAPDVLYSTVREVLDQRKAPLISPSGFNRTIPM